MITLVGGPWAREASASRRRGSAARRLRQISVSRLEALEERACPSVYYDNSIVASTSALASGLTAIQPDASINDSGQVALVGSVAAGQEILVGNGTSAATNISGTPTASRTFGPEIQINNGNQVAAVAVQPGATSTAISRIYNLATPGTFTNIAVGASPKITSSNFDTVASFSSISNDGNVALAGFESNATTWEIHQSDSLVDSRDIFNFSTQATTLPAGAFFRQQSADGDLTLVSSSITSGSSVARSIALYHVSTISNSSASIASTSSGSWSELGIRPGISDDGSVVVFYGNLTAAGATATGLTAGPGIFASIENGSTLSSRRLLRLTGGAQQNLGFDDSGTAIQFASYQTDSQVSVILQAPSTASGVVGDTLVASFVATPGGASRTNPQTGQPLLFTANNKALWTVRADVVRPLSDPFPINVSSPLVVAQVGSPLVVSPVGVTPAVVITVADLAASDALAQDPRVIGSGGAPTSMPGDHQVAFWVKDATGNQMIVRGTHLDTDQDGLLDQWERPGGGIDINQDGTVDLSLNALGASVNHRDLFLEMDWLRPVTGPLPGQPGLPLSNDAPLPAALQQLVAEFAAAPVSNPDGTTGITLHIDAGPLSVNFPTGNYANGRPLREGGDLITAQGTGSHIDVVYFSPTNNDPSYLVNGAVSRSFDSIKQAYFGTADLDARELGFHYVVLADYQNFVRDSQGNPVRYVVAAAQTVNVTYQNGSTAQLGSIAVAGATFPAALTAQGAVIKITGGPDAGAELPIEQASGNTLYFAASASLPSVQDTFTLLTGSSGMAELTFQDPTLNDLGQTAQPFDPDTLPGNDVLISLGQGFRQGAATLDPTTMTPDFARQQSQTLLHELGHNLGLQHAGANSRRNSMIANYPSVMSYDHQFGDGLPYSATNPNGYVSDYSSGGAGIIYNDWANIRMDFQDNLATLGNSFGLNGNSTVQTTDTQDDYVSPKQLRLQLDPNADVTAPFVAVDSPVSGGAITLGADLVVNFRAADDVALSSVAVQFDVDGDGTLVTATPVAVGPGMYRAVFPNVAGPVGDRSILVSAVDTSNNITTEFVSIGVTTGTGVGTPTANDQAAVVDEDGSVTLSLTGSDPDSPPLPLTYAIVGGLATAHGTITNFDPATGALTYTPQAGYFGPDSFQFTASNGTNTSAPATVSLMVNQVSATIGGAVGVSWGAAGTATLQTDADGLRLLPAGRSTDLPWLGINKLTITLDRATTLAAADVAVTGLNVADYGPVVVAGSGTTYTITLAQPINAADRVTISIGNAMIAPFTRRLDVLPGDFNDDGVVTLQDAVLIRNIYLNVPGVVMSIFGDINGDGVVDINDFNTTRSLIGKRLP